MKIEDIEIKINLTKNDQAPLLQPVLQPLLRDTSRSALIAEQLKKNFYNDILKHNFCAEAVK